MVRREDIRLRPAEPRDEGFLRSVYADSRADELAQVAWPDGALDAFLRMQFDAQASHYVKHYPGAEFLIIERDGAGVGRLYLHRVEREIRVIDIAILAPARGAGIGTLLLREILEEARAKGQVVSIHVEQFNPARRLYDRLGFQAVELRGVYWLLEWRPS